MAIDFSWFNSLRRERKLLDVEVYCCHEEEPIEAHRIILGGRSKYFRDLFSDHLTEPRIRVEGIKKRVLEILINYIYTDDLDGLTLSEDNVLEILDGATLIKLPSVQTECHNFLAQLPLSTTNCLKILEGSHFSGLKRLADSAAVFFLQNQFAMTVQPDFLKIDHELLSVIIKNGVQRHYSAHDLLHLVILWLEHDPIRFDQTASLLSSIPLKDIDKETIISKFSQANVEFKGQVFETILRVTLTAFESSSGATGNSIGTERPVKTEEELNGKVNRTGSPSQASGARISTRRRGSSSTVSVASSANGDTIGSPRKRKSRKADPDNPKKRGRKRRKNMDSPKVSLTAQRNARFSFEDDSAKSPPPRDKAEEKGLIYFICAGPNDYSSANLVSYHLETGRYKNVHCGAFQPWRDRCAVVYHDDNIFLIGGKSFKCRDVNSVLVYSMTASMWRKDTPKTLEQRSDYQCVVLDDLLYAAGGCQNDPENPEEEKEKGEDIIINCVERLPPEVPGKNVWKWKSVDYMHRARSDYGMTVCDHKIYVFGGYAPGGPRKTMGPSSSIESYDPNLDMWVRMTTPMRKPKFGHCAVTVEDTDENGGSRIYILGGGDTYDEDCLKYQDVEIYDPKRETWEDGPAMISGRQFGSAVYYNGFIYAIGGDNDDCPTIEKLRVKFEVGGCQNGEKKNDCWVLVGPLRDDGQYGSVAFRG